MINQIKTAQEIDSMREGGAMLVAVLKLMKQTIEPGITPRQLALVAANELKKLGGEPAFLGYGEPGYPDVICISVNNQVQHSIPTNEPIEGGDVVNFDFGVRYKGLVTDAGLSMGVGSISRDAKRLLDGTLHALETGISRVKNGAHVGDVSSAVEQTLLKYNLGIVRDLVGHGVGHELHEEPNIPNYGRAQRGPLLKEGMTIAIEPIATLGEEDIVVDDSDNWTLWTADGSWSAQFERTVLVTSSGFEDLTPW